MATWRSARFKGKPVFAEVDAEGGMVVSQGRVPIRYSDKPGAKVYNAGGANVSRIDGESPVELEAGVAAESRPSGRASSSKGSGFGSAGRRSKAQEEAAR